MNPRLLTLLLLATPPAVAQCDGFRMVRSKQNYKNEFGTAVDLDAGLLAVGAPGVNHPFRSGHVYLYDFETLEKLHKIRCDAERAWMGTSLDLDGDQILIGAPSAFSWNSGDGRVYLFDLAGAPFELNSPDALLEIDGPHTDHKFGFDVAMDGETIVVGAPEGNRAYAYDRATGQLRHEWSGVGRFGHSVAIEGNVCVVGAPNAPSHSYGSVHVFDVVTGLELYELQSPAPWSTGDFGYDVDLDAGRLLVGDAGWARSSYLFDVATGEVLMGFASLEDADDFGYSVSLEGNRALIGEPKLEGGAAHLFDTETGARLAMFFPEVNYTWAAAGREVLLHEGGSIVGAPIDNESSHNAGSIWISRLGDADVSVYCDPAVPNSTGVPARIRADACGELDDGHLGISAVNLPQNQFGLFLTSPAQDLVPFPGGSDGILCLGSPIGRFTGQLQKPGVLGTISLQVDVTALPMSPLHAIRPGETWNFQLWYRDLNPAATSNFTDAVSVTFPLDVR